MMGYRVNRTRSEFVDTDSNNELVYPYVPSTCYAAAEAEAA